MHVSNIEIRNFRGIKEISVPMDEFCVLIGENNTGKSTAIDALRICLTADFSHNNRVFENYDYHLENLEADPTTSQPIEISLTIKEQIENEWPKSFTQDFEEILQQDPQGLRHFVYRVKSKFDLDRKEFSTELKFLNEFGESIENLSDLDLLERIRQRMPVFHLESLRDAVEEFQPNARFVGTFFQKMEVDAETRRSIERKLTELNSEILRHNTRIEDVTERLEEIFKIFPVGNENPIAVEAIPLKLFELISRTQVNLPSQNGAQIPIRNHGSGIQSLAVIMLFDAFLRRQMKEELGADITPLILMEEPESHLHPSAAIAFGNMLKNLPGQKIFTCHSGDMLSKIEYKHIYKFTRRNGEIEVHWLKLDKIEEEMKRHWDHHIRKSRGALLFSQCWLLVEGEVEATILPECARAVGIDFDAHGVSCVEFSQSNVSFLISLAEQFGIEWFVLADNDLEGKNVETSAKNILQDRNFDEHVRLLDFRNMELQLCMNGFGGIYEKSIQPGHSIDEIRMNFNGLEYWIKILSIQKRKTKTDNAVQVVNWIELEGESLVPQLLREVVRQVARRAKGVRS